MKNLPHHDNLEIVNFIICGTQKAGTSALDAYLRDHPNVCMAKDKEVHFFDNEELFHHNNPNYEQYHTSFPPCSNQMLRGEATPIYLFWHDAPRRIWEYNPKMKLIVLLRNPIDRAYSHWNMECYKNKETLSFWDAITNESKRCREALPYQHRIFSYIDRGFYLSQLRKLWLYFPKEHVLIMKQEQLKSDPKKVLQQVCNFLKIDHFEKIETKNVLSLPYESKMKSKEREYLKFIFEAEIHGIERELDMDCSDWLR